MKQKSILIIGNYPPPFGGVPRHIEYLVPYLVEKGWDVHVLSSGGTGVEHKNGFTVYKGSRRERIFSTEFFSFVRSSVELGLAGCLRSKSSTKESLKQWIWYAITTSDAKHIIEKNGIGIISAYNLHNGGPVGAVLSQAYDIPLVLTNFGELYSMRGFFERNLGLLNWVCKRSEKLLAMSAHCAKSYGKLGISPDVEVIPYGVDVNRFSPNADGYRVSRRLGIDSKDKVVLFVGRMIRDMGMHTVLEVIPRVLKRDGKIKFIIVGKSGELLPAAVELTEKYKGRVFVAPDVPLGDLPSYYAVSTIVVVPTKGDRACGSLAAVEAMATGKPVIASKVGGIPEIVIDGETGILTPPGDLSSLVRRILELTADEELLSEMSKAGRERAEEMFNKDVTNQRIEQIFSGIAGV